MLADKAYSARAIRTRLRRCGIKATIAQPVDQIGHRRRRGSRGGRPPAFDKDIFDSDEISTRPGPGARRPVVA